ncbi:hypothetical protein [Sinomonas terrae]|uniref:Uncharacterized protein n=1 Tax=Sinomonas terrae TaxID=2908838 RepID=A0ABS9U403_9MICC|nr:hypothetical protein [Sinomonas terrae]MCH6471242.1 hypothetical protein [Sinomonas terrae]
MKAAVNEIKAAVTFPLDAYIFSPEEWEVVSSANSYLTEDCVRAQGRPLMGTPGDLEITEYRRYGPWVMRLVEVNGWQPVKIKRADGIYDSRVRYGAEGPPDDAVEASRECRAQLESIGELIPEITPGWAATANTVVGEISAGATNLTYRDPEYRQINNQWLTCIKAEGLTPDPAHGEWGVAMGNSSKEQQIRDAVKDVRCKQKFSVMQRLSDIEAQYQAALMGPKEAQLAELAKTKQDALARARKVLAEHGA